MPKKQMPNNPTLSPKSLQIVEKILSKNDQKAKQMREIYARDNLYVINLMSSPGSGKTTLLEQFADIKSVGEDRFSFAVIEGDLQTNRDATRLESKGIAAHQILTGAACHLEAAMIETAYNALKSRDALSVEYLFIENVGNLVCPASYDLGADLNIVLLSSTEGDDKVLKYPSMFLCADAVVISKSDVCEVFGFTIAKVQEDLAKLKPNVPLFCTSSKDRASIENLARFIVDCKKAGYHSSHCFS